MSSQSICAGSRPRTVAMGAWSRLLIPSLSDVLFVFVMVWSFLAGENGWMRLLMDASVALQIRAGDFMLAHHQIPTHDIFSFAYAGRPWYLFEWLSELLFGAVHSVWGLRGVVLLTGLVLAATIAVLFRSMLARGADCLLALLLTLTAANAMNVSFMARPQIFTLALLAISAWLIEADRRRPGRAVWLLPPLTVLWTNLHGGFLILFPLLGLLVAGALIEGWIWPGLRTARVREARRYSGLLAACFLASLLNPYGAKFHKDVLFYLADPWVGTFVKEFQSPSFRSETLLCYMAMLFLALIVCGWLLLRRRVTEVLWIGFFAYCSLIAVRHVPLFMVIATPIACEELSRRWSSWARAQSRTAIARTLDDIAAGLSRNAAHTSVWIPVGVVALLLSSGWAWPADFPAELFPARIVARHADLIATSRVYTSDQWADYLIYRNYPRQRVFMDDRHQYYSLKVRTDYLAVDGGTARWEEILDEYNVNAVLGPSRGPLASLLRQRAGWVVVDEDKLAVLFTRRENK